MNNNIKDLEILFKKNKHEIVNLENNINKLEFKLFENLNIKPIKLNNKLDFEVEYNNDILMIHVLDLHNKQFELQSILNIYIESNNIEFSFNFHESSKEYIQLYSFILDCINDYSFDMFNYSSFLQEYKKLIHKMENLKSENVTLNKKIKSLYSKIEIQKINNVLYYIEEEKALEFYYSLIEDKKTKTGKIVYFDILNDTFSFKEFQFVINFFSCSKPKIKIIYNAKSSVIDEDKFINLCKKQFYFNNTIATDLSNLSFLNDKKYASIKQISDKLKPHINASKF